MKQKQKNIFLPFSWKQIGYFILGLLLIAVFYFNLIDLISNWTRLGLGRLIKNRTYSLSQLAILKDILFAGLILFATIISFAKGVKLGLKPYNEEGLIYYLTKGLFRGSVGGLVCGLIIGLAFGLIIGLVGGLIVGLTFCLIVVLIYNSIFFLIEGLIFEIA